MIEILDSDIYTSEIEYIQKNVTKFFTIKWRMTEWCNYRCSYCIRKEKISKEKQTTEELAEKAENIKRIIEDAEKPVFIQLIGGEVTQFDLETIFKEFFCEKIKKISITTNFSNSIEYYEKLYNFCKNNNVELILTGSFHEEFTNIDVYMKKITKLNFVRPEMVITPNNIEIAKDFIKRLKDNDKIKLAILDFDRKLPPDDKNAIKKFINNEKAVKLEYTIKTKSGEELMCDKAAMRRNLKFDTDIYCNNLKYMVYINDNGNVYDSVCKYKKKITDLKNYSKGMLEPSWRKCPGKSCSVCSMTDFKFNEE